MRILQTVHALPPDTVGGTELYTQRVARALANDHEVAIATPRGADASIDGVSVFALPDRVDGSAAINPGNGVVHEEVDARFAELLDAFDPDVVHFQHFKGLSATLPSLCSERDVACLATLHDFWMICHREQLFRPDETRCRGPESVAKCTDCYREALAQHPDRNAPAAFRGSDARPVQRRTDRLTGALKATDRLISPSAFLREKFIEFGVPPSKIVHRRNGIRTEGFNDTGFDPTEPIRIGYAGRITELKGVHHLIGAFEDVEGDAELHVYGRFDPDREYHARLAALADERVTFHGRYEDPAAPYAAMDVFVLPSIWYENSPLVIQEAFAARVPVITGNVGGMAELVTHGRDGLTFAVGDTESLADRLNRVVESPAVIERLRRGIEEPKHLSEHADELVALYADLVGGL